MTDTIHLGMPFIEGSQAQKHVTHNEALRILDAAVQIGVLDTDQTTPPPTPADGDRHIVPSGATGAWAGHADAVAVREDGAWRFLVPRLGWCAWSDADGVLLVYDGAAWTDVASGGGGSMSDSIAQFGINDTASDPNLLTVRSNAALFNAIDVADGGTGDMRLQISKEATAKTASVVFSDAFSGRAEFGLIGSDAFKLKVSDDGTTFAEALVVDQTSGNILLPRGVALTGVISPSQITSNQNDYNPTGMASASVLNLSSDASRSVTGLAGGSEGRVVALINTGSQNILLPNESVLSTAANRFALGNDLAVGAKQSVMLRYDGTASRWYAIARPVGRVILTANRTYYVRTDGNDNNDGLSNASGGAFLTIQKAIDAAAALDISTFNVTIQIANGTYTGAISVSGPWIGSGTVFLVGDTTTPSNVTLNVTGNCVFVTSGGRLDLKGMKFTSTGSGLHARGGSAITVSGAVEFGANSSYLAYAETNGAIYINANFTVSGSAYGGFGVATFGSINISSRTAALTGTPAFSAGFAAASVGGLIIANGFAFTGSATGPRYSATTGGGIFTFGGGASFFPGNAAGTATSPGWYN